MGHNYGHSNKFLWKSIFSIYIVLFKVDECFNFQAVIHDFSFQLEYKYEVTQRPYYHTSYINMGKIREHSNQNEGKSVLSFISKGMDIKNSYSPENAYIYH